MLVWVPCHSGLERHVKRTILIIHPGALGDVLLAVPAIRSLSTRFPRHETVLIASAAVSRLLLDCGVIDDWDSLEGQSCLGLFSKTLSISEELQSRVNRCDLAVAWTEDRDGILHALFREAGVGLVQIQSPFSPALRARHQSNRFLEMLGKTAEDISPGGTVQVRPHLSDWGRDFLETLGISHGQSLVLVHPGSGSIHKCLEPRRMSFLVEQLWRSGMCPMILEGPADRDVVGQVLQFVSKPPLVLRNLDLSQLAGVLAQVTLYIGHDSGVTHLSALLGVSTIALFGPTDPQRWAPRGSRVRILRGSPCKCESWETVKKCAEKACLQVPIEEILTASGFGSSVSSANPRNSM
ncbi:MAG: glycosyltransferase family 9 protein [Nitrospira sp. LK70]|nr:glycosyltransferase family 9 protein [Nitrospira sp. LK70]